MSGWVKLHRAITEWGWYSDIPTRLLFIHLLLKAQYRDSEFLGHPIKRGSLATGYPALSENIGISIQQTRTALARLKSTGEVTVKVTNKMSIITVVNYELYQDATGNLTDNQQSTNSQLTDNQQTINSQLTVNQQHNKNIKKERKEEVRKKETNNSFEVFWKTTTFPKRPTDVKGEILKKYQTLLKQGLTDEKIFVSSCQYAELNIGNNYTVGLRKFLEKETVESYLNGDNAKALDTSTVSANVRNLEIALGGGNGK